MYCIYLIQISCFIVILVNTPFNQLHLSDSTHKILNAGSARDNHFQGSSNALFFFFLCSTAVTQRLLSSITLTPFNLVSLVHGHQSAVSFLSASWILCHLVFYPNCLNWQRQTFGRCRH